MDKITENLKQVLPNILPKRSNINLFFYFNLFICDLFNDADSNSRQVGFEVLTAVSTKMAVFWVVAPCSLVEVY
jgi:hypothetical protein